MTAKLCVLAKQGDTGQSSPEPPPMRRLNEGGAVQRLRSATKLDERWMLGPEDPALLADLPGAGKLGLAAHLAY